LVEDLRAKAGLRTKEGFVKRELSFWAEETAVVDPVGGLEVDDAIVGV